jgi:hypothetical protein
MSAASGMMRQTTLMKEAIMAPVIELNRDELIRRRDEIVSAFNLDERGFVPVEERRDLSTDEWIARERLEGIEYLLGER